MFDSPHRRLNLLTREWVLVSPQRARRPWQGQVEKTPPENQPQYDPTCYLCPGNERAGGVKNPAYTGTFVFDNDFAALLPEEVSPSGQVSPLFQTEPERGVCRVICFSPRHDLSMPQLSIDDAEAVVTTWSNETAALFRRPEIAYVQVFENKGAVMGCSQPHPHGQIWANSFLPNEAATEDKHQREYYERHGRALLVDYAAAESGGERVVVETDHWLAVVPYWAAWPFETLLLPKAPALRLPDLDDVRRNDLAVALKQLTSRYDNLFQCSFPYSMGWHGAPFNGEDNAHWQLHAHFYPPLLRSASVRKFMVGYEMLAEPQRDLTPEQAAERLRAVGSRHYLES